MTEEERDTLVEERRMAIQLVAVDGIDAISEQPTATKSSTTCFQRSVSNWCHRPTSDHYITAEFFAGLASDAAILASEAAILLFASVRPLTSSLRVAYTPLREYGSELCGWSIFESSYRVRVVGSDSASAIWWARPDPGPQPCHSSIR
jgi:hypothetical protein